MKQRPFTLLAPLFLCAAAFAQAPQVPQPAPELKKLDYFAGTWKTDADMKPSPYGQGGKLTITNKFEWMQGNFFMVIHTNWSGGGMGKRCVTGDLWIRFRQKSVHLRQL